MYTAYANIIYSFNSSAEVFRGLSRLLSNRNIRRSTSTHCYISFGFIL